MEVSPSLDDAGFFDVYVTLSYKLQWIKEKAAQSCRVLPDTNTQWLCSWRSGNGGVLPRLICLSLVKPYWAVGSGDESLLQDTEMSAPLLFPLLTSCVALGTLLHHLFLHPAFVCAGDGCRAFCSQMQGILQSEFSPHPDPKWHDQGNVVPSLR